MTVPISVKGVCFLNNKALLLQNDRGEWELPGGRFESAVEQPEQALQREFREETGMTVSVGTIIDSWLFEVLPGRHVFIVSYLVTPVAEEFIKISHEHGDFFLADPLNLPISLPPGYARTIRRALQIPLYDPGTTLPPGH
jgi:8-oxo-dGTP pyrophosphatase MutT (NUDIX family)